MSEQGRFGCTICSSLEVKEMIAVSDKAKIMICRNCKNAFTYPKPEAPDYALEDFQAGKGDAHSITLFDQLPEEIKKSYHIQLEMIEKNIPKGSTVLEIGGGEGIFLEMLKKSGYEVELVEPSISAAQRAIKRGLKVQNTYLQNASFDRKYSLICMSHVLEHINDPIGVIKKVKNLLEPNGCILLAQTNFKGFMPRFLKANWYGWVPEEHFSHFSLSGLQYLAEKSSLSVSAYKYSRLVHGPSIYHKTLKFIPFVQDQIHMLLQLK